MRDHDHDLDHAAVGLDPGRRMGVSVGSSDDEYLDDEDEEGASTSQGNGDDASSQSSQMTVNSGGASGLAGVFQPDMLDLAQSKGVEPKTLRAWLGQMESLLTEVTTMESLMRAKS